MGKRLILALTAVKSFLPKSFRDWISAWHQCRLKAKLLQHKAFTLIPEELREQQLEELVGMSRKRRKKWLDTMDAMAAMSSEDGPFPGLIKGIYIAGGKGSEDSKDTPHTEN
jgi:hypothetical protein